MIVVDDLPAAVTVAFGARLDSEYEYNQAVAEVERLFGSPAASVEAERFAHLAAIVEAYEKEHHVIGPPSVAAAREYDDEKRGGLLLG